MSRLTTDGSVLQRASAGTRSQGRKVAIAEDNDSLRSLLHTVLEKGGYDVVAEADNGADAVAIVAAYRPDFVILDERMPYMNGTKAARLIRAAAPNVRIVMWSGVEVEDRRSIDAEVSKHHIQELPDVLDALAGKGC